MDNAYSQGPNLVGYLRMNIFTLLLSPVGIVNYICLLIQEN